MTPGCSKWIGEAKSIPEVWNSLKRGREAGLRETFCWIILLYTVPHSVHFWLKQTNKIGSHGRAFMGKPSWESLRPLSSRRVCPKPKPLYLTLKSSLIRTSLFFFFFFFFFFKIWSVVSSTQQSSALTSYWRQVRIVLWRLSGEAELILGICGQMIGTTWGPSWVPEWIHGIGSGSCVSGLNSVSCSLRPNCPISGLSRF